MDGQTIPGCEDNIFHLPKEAEWFRIEQAMYTENIAETLDTAIHALENTGPCFKGLFSGSYAAMSLDSGALSQVIEIFSGSDTDGSVQVASEEPGSVYERPTSQLYLMKGIRTHDLLGRIYEYCLAKFAEKDGQRGGEFFTPPCVSKLLASILDPEPGSTVYDCCCGSGGMFLQSERFAGNSSIRVYGQESNPDIWRLARKNMLIHGIDADLGPKNADTFTNDLHTSLKADYILANPPFNYHPWGQEQLLHDERWKYGLPPAGNANFAWIQHMLSHLAPGGKIGLVLSNGSMTDNTLGQKDIRQRIIEADLVEGIIALPSKLFYSTRIPACLWFLSDKKARKGKTLFIDARKMGHMADRTHRVLSDTDILYISDVFRSFRDGSSVKNSCCAVVGMEEIAEHGYVLAPGRYTFGNESRKEEKTAENNLLSLASELTNLFEESHRLEEAIKHQLEEGGFTDA